jgi:predicted transcriptional regulator
MKQQQLLDALLASKARGIQENRILDLEEKIPQSLPLLTTGKRAGRRAVRSQREIEMAILDSCRVPTVQHWIMVKARLGYDTFWKHMNELLSVGLMEEISEGCRTMYQVNSEGLKLLSEHSTR